MFCPELFDKNGQLRESNLNLAMDIEKIKPGFRNFNETFYMKIYCLLLPYLTIICLYSSAQSNTDQVKQSSHQKLKHGIDSKQFHFLASSATTSKGSTVQLTGGYFLFLGGDSLTVSLPFLERPANPVVMGHQLKMQELTFILTNSLIWQTPQRKEAGKLP